MRPFQPVRHFHHPPLTILIWTCLSALIWAATGNAAETPALRYTVRDQHSPDGQGKFYMGREIALVMGHSAADWLERPTRDTEEHTGLLMELIELRPGEVVADVGAGSGYFTSKLAKAVGPQGRVLAVDIQPEMLDILTNRLAKENISNVQPVLGTSTDPKLPANTLDLVLLVDVYHEFSHPYEMMESIVRALKPGGKVVLVEFRAEDPSVPIKPLHKMSEAQVKKEMAVLPLEFVVTKRNLPRQHLIIFRKPTGTL